MARTFSGLVFYNASQLYPSSALNLVGDVSTGISLVAPASATTVIACGIADVKRPYFNFPQMGGYSTASIQVGNENLEAFGTGSGTPGDPIGPGFSNSQTKPWGLAVVNVFAIYNVVGATATSVTLKAYRSVFANNVAIASTQLVNSAAGPVAVQANPYVFQVALAQPLVYESTDLSDVGLELSIVTPTSSTLNVYGMGAHVAVEYT